jgi:hypothetical protein
MWLREMAPGALVGIRPSMKKFGCQNLSVEVCCVARALPCAINRQIIMALLTLGIPPETFLDMYKAHVHDLDHLLRGGPLALMVCFLITHLVIICTVNCRPSFCSMHMELKADHLSWIAFCIQLLYSSPPASRLW